MTASLVELARAFAGTVNRANERDERNEKPGASASDPVGATAANVAAATDDERAGWRREVVAALRWTETGHDPDPHLGHDLAALRRLVPPGVCLDCGEPAPRDGRHWCAACESAATEQKEGAA